MIRFLAVLWWLASFAVLWRAVAWWTARSFRNLGHGFITDGSDPQKGHES